MPVNDPNTWLEGAVAVKTAFDTVRAAIATLRDVRSLGGGTEQQHKVVDQALDQAERSTVIAEAEVAKALGYELCKCTFPPTVMLTVGCHNGRPTTGPVFECPKCGFNTAYPFDYTRIAPGRD